MCSTAKMDYDLDALYEEYHLTLKKISLCHCDFNNDLAEEAVQQSYLALMESIEKGRIIENVLTYLSTIAINYLRTYFKKRNREPLYENITDYSDTVRYGGDVEDIYLEQLTEEKLAEALLVIKEKDEAWHYIASRVYIEGVSQVEVAKELGISNEALYARIRRFKTWANKNLIEYKR